MTQVLVIGEPDDPHVAAVLERLRLEPLVIDAHSLRTRPYVLDDRGLTVAGDGKPLTVSPDAEVRGWVRRVVPDFWLRSVRADSLQAAEASGWTSLLAAILQLSSVTWLTPVGAITRAENKLTQAAAASKVGVRTPRTIVTNDASFLAQSFEGEVVIKPLGAGHYVEGDIPYVVHATAAMASTVTTDTLRVAPFLVQQSLRARRHWRVVTVGGEVWSAALEAEGYPLDWRRDPRAHSSFVDVMPPLDIETGALSTAEQLKLGYSSQDWIETDGGVYLVDVNPSGQWLFLPESIGAAVALAIANWLDGTLANDG